MRALILLLFIVSLLQLNAQNYFNETSRWQQHFQYQNSSSLTHCNKTLYFDGDTVINEVSYRKLFADEVCIFSQFMWDEEEGTSIWVDDTVHSINPVALLRESNKKVFFLGEENNEYLRYDFGKPDYTNIDSVDTYTSCGMPTSVQIMDHDTVCIGPIGRKRWTISPSQYPNAYFFIEGVGPSSGFLAPVCRNGCPECGFSLTNYVLNGDTLYQGTCSIPASIITKKPIQPLISQSANRFEIQFPGIEILTLYSGNGQFISTHKTDQKDVITLPTDHLAKGVYIYHVSSNNNPIAGRFVIVR